MITGFIFLKHDLLHIEEWGNNDSNTNCLHSALGGLITAGFAAQYDEDLQR